MALKDEITAAGGAAEYAKALLKKMHSINAFDGATPVEAEVAQESAPIPATGLAFGMVTECLDEERAGRIKVQSSKFGEGPQTCDYVSPIAGAGYGLFAVPGIGSIVLVGENTYGDNYPRYFWLGCLYAAGQREIPGVKSQPYAFGQDHITQMVKTEVMDNGEEPPNTPTVSFGVPNENDVYQDNDLPDSFVLKHLAGHSISLTDKNTPERKVNEIKLKSAGNKKLILSDAPAEAGGERIYLGDENGNSICIATEKEGNLTEDSINTFANGNINVDSAEGSIDHTISSKSNGDYVVTNAGTGDIDIGADNGHITLEAKAGITIKCGACSIVMTPDAININGPNGDVIVSQTSLNRHTHPTLLGDVPGPTGPPVP